MTSNFSALSDTTVVSGHGPDAYERVTYYNGIDGDGDHPELVYCSDSLTMLLPKPVGRFSHIPVKSLRGVFGTPLNKVWDDTVRPQIRDESSRRKRSSGPPLAWPASSHTVSREKRTRGVSVRSLYGLASCPVLPPPTPPTISLSRSLLFCGRTMSRAL
jgi:hypothetical protein